MTQQLTTQPNHPIINDASAGSHYNFLNHVATVKVAATGSRSMSVVQFDAPKGFGPPLHTHRAEDELFVILDGSVILFDGPDKYEAPEGTIAYLARGRPHTFLVTTEPARILNVTASRTTAPRFDEMVAALGEAIDSPVAGAIPDRPRTCCRGLRPTRHRHRRPPTHTQMKGTTMKRHTFNIAAFALAISLVASACSSDSGDTTTTDAPATTITTTTTVAEPDSVEVTAIDYAYVDLPAEVKAGTAFTLKNTSEVELHEFVAFKLPDDETRSVHEIMMLPPEEGEALLEPGMTTVILAPPGSNENIVPVGDGILHEPGRYAILCFIPTGIAPQEYMDAVAATGEPPTSGDPPHFVHGMMGEIIVTE